MTNVIGKESVRLSASAKSIWKKPLPRYQAEMEELQKSRKEIIRQAKEEAERLLQESNARIENTIRTIKEAQAEKEKTRLVRQELADFRESIDNLTSKEQEDKIARKMEKLKEKQNRKKEKKQNGTKEQPTVQQTPKATPITEGCPVRIKGQSSVGEVLEINGKNAVVAFGSIKTTVKTERLERSNAVPQKTRVCQKFFCQQPDSGQHVRKKAELQARYRCTGNAGRRSSTSCNLLCRRRHPGRYEPGTHPTWDRYGYPAYPYPPIFANHTGSPPFCRRTYPIGRCRYHGSRFGIKKEEYEE